MLDDYLKLRREPGDRSMLENFFQVPRERGDRSTLEDLSRSDDNEVIPFYARE